ncbi:hypothetical protein E2C01_056009 [Portunus trituberculatus]|uniref:Uncharacterized protein n=1 Tax=Portunus trituberculatus TaxID=210409 RepID=A0A5B7GSY1_PORTR|nr:hypothetical protein [Portunus trituberculatus]
MKIDGANLGSGRVVRADKEFCRAAVNRGKHGEVGRERDERLVRGGGGGGGGWEGLGK